MGINQKLYLSVNTGSSSLKVAVFNDQLTRLVTASASDIGLDNAKLSITKADSTQTEQHKLQDHQQAAELIFNRLTINELGTVAGIGHRIVHGGPNYSTPVLIDEPVISELTRLISFDPDHMPAALRLINWCAEQFVNISQIACFDTNFYSRLPAVATTIALPKQYQAMGLRRYGFHGLSYEYVLSDFKQRAGETAANGRVIMAHLGSGASLTATLQAQAVDTTMSFSPSSGIVMSTRSGDIDPGIVSFLKQQADLSDEDFDKMINKQSGLLGVSGLSGDMELLIQRSADDQDAALAVELFCYQARKAIGSLAATLNGLDSLIFSGGIGENSALIRQKICTGLNYLGVELDPERNHNHDFLISGSNSQVGVHVIQTDEAAVIAAKTLKTIQEQEGGNNHATNQ